MRQESKERERSMRCLCRCGPEDVIFLRKHRERRVSHFIGAQLISEVDECISGGFESRLLLGSFGERRAAGETK